MKCDKCGYDNDLDVFYCANCGNNIKDKTPSNEQNDNYQNIVATKNEKLNSNISIILVCLAFINMLIILPFLFLFGLWKIFDVFAQYNTYYQINSLCISYFITSIISTIILLDNVDKKGKHNLSSIKKIILIFFICYVVCCLFF